MADQKLKCKDCGKEASKDSNFHKSSLLCNACSSRRWREKQKKGTKKPSKSQVKRVAAQEGEALTTKQADVCVDCGIAASELDAFNYKRQLCNKCRQKRYYNKGQSGKVAKSRIGSRKKPIVKVVGQDKEVIFDVVPSDKVRDFIDSQGLLYAEGSIVALVCRYHYTGNTLALSEVSKLVAGLLEKVEKDTTS